MSMTHVLVAECSRVIAWLLNGACRACTGVTGTGDGRGKGGGGVSKIKTFLDGPCEWIYLSDPVYFARFRLFYELFLRVRSKLESINKRPTRVVINMVSWISLANVMRQAKESSNLLQIVFQGRTAKRHVFPLGHPR